MAAPAASPAREGAHTIQPSRFRDVVRNEPGARFRPEAGRYALVVNHACPWAHRTLIVHALKGLGPVVELVFVHHGMDEAVGWHFTPETPEPHYGLRTLRELYNMAEPGYAGRVTIPVLWCKRERTIVNNESSEIMRMLGHAFDDLAAHPGMDLLPEAWRADIERWNERIYAAVNAGVYSAGFATQQGAYEEAVHVLFDTLGELESHLTRHRYLAGPLPTEADWRLLPTLLRFDAVYHGLFKCNLRRLVDYPQLLGYARELVQWPGITATVDMQRMQQGYWGSMRRLNPNGIVPLGQEADFTAPHGRG